MQNGAKLAENDMIWGGISGFGGVFQEEP